MRRSWLAPGFEGGDGIAVAQARQTAPLWPLHSWSPFPARVACVPSGVRRTHPVARLFKTGGRLIRHARYFILQPAESHWPKAT
jgi:hypothetical protein